MRRAIGAILAAGRSERFGEADKLLADLGGRPLAGWAASAMAELPLTARCAVCRGTVAAVFEGYRILSAPEGSGQAESLRAALWFAREMGASDLLIVLADMPLITAADMEAVLARGAAGAAAATDGRTRLPPVCIPAALFGALDGLDGDAGARELLGAVAAEQLVRVPSGRVRDVDTAADLEAIRQTVRSRTSR